MDDVLTEADRAKPPAAVRDLYEARAATHEAEIAAAGYAAPGRVAAALLAEGADAAAPVPDFGSGTGLSGAAPADAGFAVIDGLDLSPAMLARARARGLSRRLAAIAPDEAPAAGRVRVRRAEHGAHLPARGIGAVVFVLERL